MIKKGRYMKKRRHILAAMLVLLVFLLPAGKGGQVQAASGYTIYVNRRTNIVNVVNQKGKGKLYNLTMY